MEDSSGQHRIVKSVFACLQYMGYFHLLRLKRHGRILTSQQEVKVKGQHVYPYSHSHHRTLKLMEAEPLLFPRN